MIDGYIDRNRLLQHLNDWWWAVSPNTKEPLFLNGILQKTYKMEIIEECMKAVEAQPTADVVEVVHGEWVEYEDCEFDTYYKCSICGSERYFIDTPEENGCNYCPNCGAKMDGKKVE